MELDFSKDFIFGVATSAAQIEGAAAEDGRKFSIWDVYARIPGNILDHSIPDVTCDSYHRYKDDIALAKELGVDSYRFSFSWSRIIPDGIGTVNQKGLDYYKRFVDELLKNNIMPNATVYHWDLPYELERRGGWLNRDVVHWYGEYASLLFKEFGDVIPMWATINEPIATYIGYAGGHIAPGRIGEKFGRQANHHILLAHGEGVKRFRQESKCKDNNLGIVVDVWNHVPLRENNEEDIALAKLENEKTYSSYLHPVFKGDYTDYLYNYMQENDCMPDIKDGDMKIISQPIDYYGMNCYNHVIECGDKELLNKALNPTGKPEQEAYGGNYLDNGSEYYPDAIYDALHIVKEKFDIQVPIYISENGVANCNEEVMPDGSVHDKDRILYLNGMLSGLKRAIDEGIDVRGYYLWSLLDNWEWAGGYTYRYGLYHTDFETLKRTPKDSALWYKKLCMNRINADKN